MRILVTGGAGFAGHHLVEHLMKNTDWDIVVVDKLNYASTGWSRLRDVDVFDHDRITTLSCDFTSPIAVGVAQEIGEVDYIVHMGAETHVDKSIENPIPFVMSNVVGTMMILEYARKLKCLRKLLYFSTDEIFGPAPDEVRYKEWDRYNSANPYAASKAGGEELCMAYANTYGLPIVVTHTMNIFGERQHPEKFIPLVVKKVLAGDLVEIHSDSTKKISGSRFWIHARNVASAVLFLLDKGAHREKYNIVGSEEVSNLGMAKAVSLIIGKELNYKMVDFHTSRPGHDLRYALDGDRIKQMGFKYPRDFSESLRKTVQWTLDNRHWLSV